MVDLIVELRQAGELVDSLAKTSCECSHKEYVLQLLGERLLELSSRCENILSEMEENERGDDEVIINLIKKTPRPKTAQGISGVGQ